MTARLVFEAVLTELSKVKAPSISLSEFNYYFNKAINLYVNKSYNSYDVNLVNTDIGRVLKATAQLIPTRTTAYNTYSANTTLGQLTNQSIESLYGATYEVDFPSDYLHILNCVCIYLITEQYKCWDAGTYVLMGATRLTADSWSTIINDYYNRPTPERPYYYLHNVNTSNILPTNKYIPDDSSKTLGKGTDWGNTKEVTVDNRLLIIDEDGSIISTDDGINLGTESTGTETTVTMPINLARELKISSATTGSLVEKTGGVRYGNASTVRCEIRYGKDDSVFKLVGVDIDYLKAPQYIRLTLEQVDMTRDTSQMMEFPDFVCQEIINELTHLVMERDVDPRLQTNIPISTSIASAAQQLTATTSAS